ncbi:MAG: hypothetical protein ACRD50_14190 [Candidatus Acidiferrales bacterium]
MPLEELSPRQRAILERLQSRGFILVAFPMYANYIGVRRGECAALISAVEGAGFRIFGDPCILISGNLSVRITRAGKKWFVWKKQSLEVTPERLAALAAFSQDLAALLRDIA